MCVGCVLVSVGGGSILHKEEPGSQGYAIVDVLRVAHPVKLRK